MGCCILTLLAITALAGFRPVVPARTGNVAILGVPVSLTAELSRFRPAVVDDD